ncbi:F-box/kelch-repeat protein At3g06240 [Cajanus cajan]|uniref:F-box/kelch-repeat protein At3g06240 family n=1 Tax=Cajanus cajan TaxID=3821 RepID=A0A151STL0_CAJCA|nr:F-box/kelch-repeat protein At3g06240 [Cajanus cajan]KYP58101.1 F-box/kelch-repeat protein At3g06240 family [Cajanus cajan]
MKRGKRTRRKKKIVLPTELIIQILLRLPVKSLLRFKCVSKSWYSLISDSHFAKSHFELVATGTQRLLFIEPSIPVIRSIDFNASLHDDSASFALNLNFPHPTRIIGSCRGLVLLDCWQSLLVWNPSTGFHKQLSHSPIASDMDAFFFTFLYGFGYDSSTDDYLVVQVSYNPTLDVASRVEFFSLRANAWKEIEDIHLSYMNSGDDERFGSLLNDAIHWLAFRDDVSMNVIVAFDLMERSFSEIPLPAVDLECEFYFCELKVLGESLSLCIAGCDSPAEIWVMEEYKVQSSWTKTIVVPVDAIPSQYFSFICSTKCGDIVGTDGNTGLVKCNDEGQLEEYQTYCDGSHRSLMVVYTETLLSLPCGDEQVKEDD